MMDLLRVKWDVKCCLFLIKLFIRQAVFEDIEFVQGKWMCVYVYVCMREKESERERERERKLCVCVCE